MNLKTKQDEDFWVIIMIHKLFFSWHTNNSFLKEVDTLYYVDCGWNFQIFSPVFFATVHLLSAPLVTLFCNAV